MKTKNRNLTPEYMTKLKELVALKLLNIRFLEGTSIAILKYSKRAFWKAAWNEHPELKETRGMIIDWETGRIIAMPFTKIFNFGENPQSETMFKPTEYVIRVEKVNGFLGIATYDKETDRVIITSSGTFDSEFCDMARSYLKDDRVTELLRDYPQFTFMFEICHPKDPHIIHEKYGAHLIGVREKLLHSSLLHEDDVDHLFAHYLTGTLRFHRPVWYDDQTFGQIVKDRGIIQHEGFIIRGFGDSDKCLKIKSTYYLTMKFISRSKKVDAIWDDPKNFLKTIDEDFHEIVRKLPARCTKEQWAEMDDQAKLAALKGLL